LKNRCECAAPSQWRSRLQNIGMGYREAAACVKPASRSLAMSSLE